MTSLRYFSCKQDDDDDEVDDEVRSKNEVKRVMRRQTLGTVKDSPPSSGSLLSVAALGRALAGRLRLCAA